MKIVIDDETIFAEYFDMVEAKTSLSSTSVAFAALTISQAWLCLYQERDK